MQLSSRSQSKRHELIFGVDVQISYVPIQGQGGEKYRKFESTVSSHKRSAGADSKASTGMYRLMPSPVFCIVSLNAIVSGTETLTPE